jgi:tetratricopeptide (TPR) repeat protein
MKLASIINSLFLILFLISCSEPKKDYILKVKLQTLTKDNIYNKDLVYDIIFDAEELNIDSIKNESKKLFLQAIDEYKNKKNLSNSIPIFKSSILIFPEAKTYYELANVLIDLNQGEEALKALEVADNLNFQPKSNIYYKKACAFGIQHKNALDGNAQWEPEYYRENIWLNLKLSFKNGFTDTLSIRNNLQFGHVVSPDEFQKIILDDLLATLDSSSNTLFCQFKKSFVDVNGKFEIPLDKIEMNEYESSISYDFSDFIPEMQNTDYGRDVSHDFYYVAKLEELPLYTALIYSSISFIGEEMQPVSTTLATYDNTGNLIAQKLISCQCSAEKVKKCTIENNIIEVEEYKREWVMAISEVPFEKNTIKAYELIATEKFKIEPDGKIINLTSINNNPDSLHLSSL